MSEPITKIVNGKEVKLTKVEIAVIKKEWAAEEAKSKTREDVEKDFRDEADKVLKRNAWVDKQIALEENR